MDNRYDDLRKKLRAVEDLPEALSWENMGPAIVDSVQSQDIDNGVSKRRWLWFALTALCICAAGVLTFLVVNDDKNVQERIQYNDLAVPHDPELPSDIRVDRSTEVANGTTDISDIGSNIVPESTTIPLGRKEIKDVDRKTELFGKVDSHDKKEDTPISQEYIEPTDLSQNEAQSKNSNIALRENKKDLASGSDQYSSASMNYASSTNSGNSDVSTDSPVEATKDISSLNADQHNRIGDNTGSKLQDRSENRSDRIPLPEERQEINILALDKNLEDLDLPERMNFPITSMIAPVIVNDPISRRLLITIGSGGTYIFPNIKHGVALSSSSELSETGIFSSAASVQIGYQISDLWDISAGIEYTTHKTKLDYYSRRDTSVYDNILVRKEINSVSGTQKDIYENRWLSGTSWQQIVHYNRYRFLSIPVIVSRRIHTTGKLSMSVGAGVRISQLISNSGRFADYHEETERYLIRDVQNKDFANSSLGLLTSLRFQYALSHDIFIGFQSIAEQTISDLDPSDHMSFRPLKLQSQFTLGYRF